MDSNVCPHCGHSPALNATCRSCRKLVSVTPWAALSSLPLIAYIFFRTALPSRELKLLVFGAIIVLHHFWYWKFIRYVKRE